MTVDPARSKLDSAIGGSMDNCSYAHHVAGAQTDQPLAPLEYAPLSCQVAGCQADWTVSSPLSARVRYMYYSVLPATSLYLLSSLSLSTENIWVR